MSKQKHHCTNVSGFETLIIPLREASYTFQVEFSLLEKRIKLSTHGRLTIPKTFRDAFKIPDGQPLVIRSGANRELVIEILPTMSDYK